MNYVANKETVHPEDKALYYEVRLAFGNKDEPGQCCIPNGTWRGLAKDEAMAKELAYQECWDSRLDATCCYPLYECKKIPRYIASAGWGHIFVGNKEEITRWVYDCFKEELVCAQVLNGNNWIKLDTTLLADLLESIHDNEVSENPDDFDLACWDHEDDAYLG